MFEITVTNKIIFQTESFQINKEKKYILHAQIKMKAHSYSVYSKEQQSYIDSKLKFETLKSCIKNAEYWYK